MDFVMNYSQSLQYLQQFLNHEAILHLEKNRAWNLDRMKLLLKWFGHPEKKFLPILIAGTKGKGSTGFFLEAILTEAGIPAGFYCSPHLETPLERIRIQGQMISRNAWAKELSAIRRVLEKKKIPAGLGGFTYFEIMTLLAMMCFARSKCRIGIFEAGLGGRLDATNVLDAPMVILTSISLDHEAILGNTLAKIAWEKSGIIRRGAQVLTGAQFPEVGKVINEIVHQKHASLLSASRVPAFRIGLSGCFHEDNAGLAVLAAQTLEKRFGLQVPEQAIKAGLLRTNWPGRMERLSHKPAFIIDGAHNPASIAKLVQTYQKRDPKQKTLLIFGTSRDKRYETMLEMLSRQFRDILLVRSLSPRARDIQDLILAARPLFHHVWVAGSAPEAVVLAKKLSAGYSEILATGSFYLIGEIRGFFKLGARP